MKCNFRILRGRTKIFGWLYSPGTTLVFLFVVELARSVSDLADVSGCR